MESDFSDFLTEIQMKMEQGRSEKLDQFRGRFKNAQRFNRMFLELLLEQFPNGVVFLLDNLESVQDADTHQLQDPELNAWIDSVRAFGDERLKLVLTSRWELPAWPDDQLLRLNKLIRGDFIRVASDTNLPDKLFQQNEMLKFVWGTLNGNPRGLEFFVGALINLPEGEQEAFLKALQDAREDLQVNMAIAKIVEHLPKEALLLLRQMTAYAIAVPVEGLQRLHEEFWNKEKVEAALNRIVSVSLVEVSDHTIHPDEGKPYEVREYLCNPLVVDWLAKQSLPSLQPSMQDLRKVAAEYLLELFEKDHITLEHALAVHQALHAAGQTDQAHQFALDKLLGWFTRQGMYGTLLEDWLPDMLKSDNPKIKADALNQQGMLNWHTGTFAEALEPLKKALAIYQELQDQEGEGATLNNISQIYKARGDLDTALDYLQRSLVIRQQIGDKAGESITLGNIGNIHLSQGDFELALNFFERDLDICQQIGDKSGEGTTLNNISQIYDARGDLDTALDYLQRSLVIRQQIGDKAGEGATLSNMGAIYHSQGKYDQALKYLNDSLVICQQIGDKSGEGTALSNMGAIYHSQGKYDQALKYLNDSLVIRQQIGDKSGEGTTLNNISQIYDARGDLDTALDYLQRSLVICKQIGDKAGEGTTLNNISQIYQARGDLDTALDYLQRSLDIRQQIGDVAGICASLINLGHIHWAKDKPQEALVCWVQAYQLASKMGYAQVLNALASLADQLKLPGGLQVWQVLAERMKLQGEE